MQLILNLISGHIKMHGCLFIQRVSIVMKLKLSKMAVEMSQRDKGKIFTPIVMTNRLWSWN